jgi:UDP-3-O-[3-hydroxymyristoyl] glucosamine N-acyltransferase
MKYSEICALVGAASPPGSADHDVVAFCNVFETENNDQTVVSWIADRNIDAIELELRRTIICSPAAAVSGKLASAHLVVVDNPRQAFRRVLEQFDADDTAAGVISPTAVIDPSAIIGRNCSIGTHVVIEAGVIIGDNCSIGHNSVLLRRTILGERVKIGNNCTIGGVGFGYEKDDDGEFIVMPHLGNVVIEDRVEIGNNTCIDRAVMGSTLLRENSKVDNLVHLSHGCDIGRNTLVIANAMIGGSVKIGDNTWIAPSVSILNQKTVGSNVMVGLAAVVIKDVPDDDVVVGNPAKTIKKA